MAVWRTTGIGSYIPSGLVNAVRPGGKINAGWTKYRVCSNVNVAVNFRSTKDSIMTTTVSETVKTGILQTVSQVAVKTIWSDHCILWNALSSLVRKLRNLILANPARYEWVWRDSVDWGSVGLSPVGGPKALKLSKEWLTTSSSLLPI